MYQLLFCLYDRIPQPKGTQGRKSSFGLQFYGARVRCGGIGTTTLRGSMPAKAGSWLITFHPHTGSGVGDSGRRQMGPGYGLLPETVLPPSRLYGFPKLHCKYSTCVQIHEPVGTYLILIKGVLRVVRFSQTAYQSPFLIFNFSESFLSTPCPWQHLALSVSRFGSLPWLSWHACMFSLLYMCQAYPPAALTGLFV